MQERRIPENKRQNRHSILFFSESFTTMGVKSQELHPANFKGNFRLTNLQDKKVSIQSQIGLGVLIFDRHLL